MVQGFQLTKFEAGPSMRIRQADVSIAGPCPNFLRHPPHSAAKPLKIETVQGIETLISAGMTGTDERRLMEN